MILNLIISDSIKIPPKNIKWKQTTNFLFFFENVQEVKKESFYQKLLFI